MCKRARQQQQQQQPQQQQQSPALQTSYADASATHLADPPSARGLLADVEEDAFTTHTLRSRSAAAAAATAAAAAAAAATAGAGGEGLPANTQRCQLLENPLPEQSVQQQQQQFP